jgi:hypothetical protein
VAWIVARREIVSEKPSPNGLLTQDEVWVQMVQDRNLSVHTYNEGLANQLYARLPRYLPAYRQLLGELQPSGD